MTSQALSKYPFVIKELPLEQIQEDPDQPRKIYKDNELKISLEKFGLQQPLIVTEIAQNRYEIIDGHRRYRCLKQIGLLVAPCRVLPLLGKGDFATLQFENQTKRMPWKPNERADALVRIKNENGFKTNRELAEHIHLSETLVGASLQIYDQALKYTEMMARYELQASYQIEFIRLKSKLRKIKDIEVSDMAERLCQKKQNKVINNAKNFRELRKIFLRPSLNEDAVYEFLKNPDMTVAELKTRTTKSKIAFHIDIIMRELAVTFSSALELTEEEKEPYIRLRDLLNKKFPL